LASAMALCAAGLPCTSSAWLWSVLQGCKAGSHALVTMPYIIQYLPLSPPVAHLSVLVAPPPWSPVPLLAVGHALHRWEQQMQGRVGFHGSGDACRWQGRAALHAVKTSQC
jgi:hypothetical protein